MQPGQAVTIALTVSVGTATTYTNYASVGGGGDPDAIPTPGSACTTEQCATDSTPTSATVYDAQITKALTSPAPTKVGDPVTYTIEVKNLTNTIPDGTVYFPVQDILPPEITLTNWSCTSYKETSGTHSGWESDCTYQNDGIKSLTGQTSNPINLKLWLDASAYPNSSRVTITVNGTLNKVGTITNTATVQSPRTDTTTYADSNLANNTSSATFTVGTPALTVVKSVDTSFVTVTPDTSNTGTAPLPASQLSPAQIKYTITVTNTGTAPASAVNVTDTLPTGLTYVSATLAKSTAANTYGTPVALANGGSGQNLSFSVGNLTAVEPGKSAQIAVTANVNLAANTNQTALLNTAVATATGVTQTTSNQVRTDVIYPKLTKRVRNVTQNTAFGTTSGGYPNDILEYCLDYRNYGSTPLNNWKLEDTIPANTSFYSISTPMDGLTFDGSKIVYGPLTLAAGASGSVCFQVMIGQPTGPIRE